ncbi:MAG: tetratricopeptide repeat protein [Lysobacteraceae bacterium]
MKREYMHWIFMLTMLAGMLGVAQARTIPAQQTITGLGSISFPTSTKSADAQTAFARGMLLLHLFEYDDAAKAFAQAEQTDPGFAMAYWGEAMTHNHGIWNQLDAKAGRAALAKLAATPQTRAAKAATAREKAYLAAVEILYDDKGDKKQRDASYSDAMQQLAKNNPHDNNAQLFAALALMGRSEGVRDVPVYLRAGVIAKASFRVNPQNPGAAHYWIHSMDDPEHAAGALEAARALSKIAPDAGHAQHMTSHIFMALGMWDDVAAANENAMRVVDAHAHAEGQPLIECGHYDYWLEYTYFQQGRYAAAENTLQACRDSGQQALAVADAHPEATGSYVVSGKKLSRDKYAQRLQGMLIDMRTTAVIESGDWNGMAVKMPLDTTGLGTERAWNVFADGYAAGMRGDEADAQAQLAAISAVIKSSVGDPDVAQQVIYMGILKDELRGLIDVRNGNSEAGIAAIRTAAERYDALPFDFGPPVPIKPPRELLGEQLLAQGKAVEAQTEFEAALKLAPNRALSMLGLARAQSAAGDNKAASATYRQLIAIWHAADADLPALIEARKYLAK